MPALYNLRRAGLLPTDFALDRRRRAERRAIDEFRDDLGAALREFAHGRRRRRRLALARRAHRSTCRATFDDPATYQQLAELAGRAEQTHHTRRQLPVLSRDAGPRCSPRSCSTSATPGCCARRTAHWRRVIIEKPFGDDLPSAQALNREILSVLAESQIYRIDHYLGKETVQNILVFRFANGIFEPLWNRNHIDHVQITVAETVDVERRGKFYDATGALRDMVPNHLFQLLTLTAMEPPTCFDAEAVRSEKAKVLEAVHPSRRRGRAPATSCAGNMGRAPSTARRSCLPPGAATSHRNRRPRPTSRSSS